MTRLHPDDIQAIAERVAALLGGPVIQPRPQFGDDLLAVVAAHGPQAGVEYAKSKIKRRAV